MVTKKVYRKKRQSKVPINKRLVRYNKAASLPIPFPTSKTITLKYAAYKAIVQTVGGVPSGTVFQLNNMFTPDTSGGGHQPYFYDELCNATMYRRITVFGAKVKVTATFDNPCELIMIPRRSSILSTNMSLSDERPNSISKMGNNGSRPIVLQHYYPINQIFGVSRNKIQDEDEFSHVWNGNPTNGAYLHLYVMNPNNAFTATASINVEIRFYCKVWDRGVVAQSA